MNVQQNEIEIYIDGACRGNPGVGGWAAIMTYGEHEKILKGAEAWTTNNRMELMAAIEALNALKRASTVKIVTDSQYVRLGITQWLPNWKARNWRKSDRGEIKNLDLWQRLDASREPHHVVWEWVKGHSGHRGNEKADTYANLAIDEFLLKKKKKV